MQSIILSQKIWLIQIIFVSLHLKSKYCEEYDYKQHHFRQEDARRYER